MDHLLTILVIVILVMITIAVGLLIGLTRRLRSSTQASHDPTLVRLTSLANETTQRQVETQRRLSAILATLKHGLRDE